MIGIIAVIVIMVVVNLLMIFAIVKSAGQLETTIKKYFIAHMGDEGVKLDWPVKAATTAAPEPAPASTPVSGAEEETASAEELVPNVGARAALQAMNQDTSQYKNASFKEDYRAMRRMDLLDKEEALKNVVEIQDQEEAPKSVFSTIAEVLDYDTAFRLSRLDQDTQQEILEESLTEDQRLVLDYYLASRDGYFDVLDFYGFICEQAQMDEDVYYVYKPKGAPDPLLPGKKIRSVEDDSITEGIKIIYKNKLYDYSV